MSTPIYHLTAYIKYLESSGDINLYYPIQVNAEIIKSNRHSKVIASRTSTAIKDINNLESHIRMEAHIPTPIRYIDRVLTTTPMAYVGPLLLVDIEIPEVDKTKDDLLRVVLELAVTVNYPEPDVT